MMKRIIQLLSCVLLLSALSGCESTQQIIKTIQENYPSTAAGGQLSTADIAAGLKQALEVGAQNSSNQLSALDGFFKNAAIKILLPEEAQKVEKTLRDLGMGSLVDKAIL